MRQRAFNGLLGYKQILSQLYVSRFEAFVFSDYHEARWKLEGSPNNSLNFSEASRWMHKSEDLVLEISKTYKGLFETVGLIRVLFPATQKLKELTNDIYQFKPPKILVRPKKDWDKERLKAWKIEAVTEVQEIVKTNITIPIENLALYLESQVNLVKN